MSLQYSRGIIEVWDPSHVIEESISAKIVNGPSRRVPYLRDREVRERATYVVAKKANGGPWVLTVTWKRLKKNGELAVTGMNKTQIGSKFAFTTDPDMVAFGRTLARELGIEWAPGER